MRSFQALSAARLLTTAPPAGLSTLDEMLRPVLPEAAQREQFARLCAATSGRLERLLAGRRQAGTAPPSGSGSGQLYCLTLNNEPLVTALLAAETEPPLRSTADLAARGYYDAGRWAPLIGAAIPPSDTRRQRRRAGGQLRGAARRPGPALVPDRGPGRPGPAGTCPVAGNAGQPTGGQLPDREPGHVRDRRRAGGGVPGAHRPAGPPADVIAQVSRMQRVYQLTPDDASMAVLLRHNLDSAFAVTRYDAAGFIRAFAGKLGGADTAAAMHARARQIFAATLSIATAYLGSRVNPGLGGRRPSVGFPRRQSAPPTRWSPIPPWRTSSARSTTATARTAARSSAPPPTWSTCSTTSTSRRPAAGLGQPAGRPARPPAGPAVPAADVRQHQHRAALHRPGQRDARVLRRERALDRGLPGARHRSTRSPRPNCSPARSTSTTPRTPCCRARSSRRRCRSTGRWRCSGCT